MIEYDIYFDGACRNVKDSRNEPFGVGVAVFTKGEYLSEFSKAIGFQTGGTNNIAEWEGCKQALLVIDEIKEITTLTGHQAQFTIYSDSEVIVKQFNGQYQIREASFKEYFDSCKEMAEFLGVDKLHWIKRELNTKADELSKQGLQKTKQIHHD